MRILIFLIIISAFLIWFGVNFRQAMPRVAKLCLGIGVVLAGFVLIGVLRLA